jgi:hypothetical protein
MGKRWWLGTAIAVALLALPVAARASQITVTEYRADWQERVWYYAPGPAQDVTIDPRGESNPVLTDHEPGAQYVDFTDDAEVIDAPTTPWVPPYCRRLTEHQARCVSNPETQATWRAATPCPDDDPFCGGLHPASGLILGTHIELYGTDVHYRDVPGSTPVDEEIYAEAGGATRTIALTAARDVQLHLWGNSTDRVYLHIPHLELSRAYNEWRDRSVDLGGGNDYAYTRDGVLEAVSCGDGTDVAIVGPEDRAAADCETVSVG